MTINCGDSLVCCSEFCRRSRCLSEIYACLNCRRCLALLKLDLDALGRAGHVMYKNAEKLSLSSPERL